MRPHPLELPDPCYLLLLALYTGERLDADAGTLTLTLPGQPEPVAIPSLPSALDAIETRGWVEIGVAGPLITDAGRYWLRRWITNRTGRTLAETARHVHTRTVRTA